MTDKTLIQNLSVSVDAAYEAVEALVGGFEKIETDGVIVYTGEHPEHGKIHIVIPAMGDGVMLQSFVKPTVIRAFD